MHVVTLLQVYGRSWWWWWWGDCLAQGTVGVARITFDLPSVTMLTVRGQRAGI